MKDRISDAVQDWLPEMEVWEYDDGSKILKVFDEEKDDWRDATSEDVPVKAGCSLEEWRDRVMKIQNNYPTLRADYERAVANLNNEFSARYIDVFGPNLGEEEKEIDFEEF